MGKSYFFFGRFRFLSLLTLLFLFFLIACSRQGFDLDSRADAGVVDAAGSVAEPVQFQFAGAAGSFVGIDGAVIFWSAAQGGDGSELYRVYRAVHSGGQDWNAPIAELSSGSSLFMDPSPSQSPGLRYYYVVRALYEGEEDGNQVEVSALVPEAEGQSVPEFEFDGVSSAFAVDGGVVVVWERARGGDGTESYRVFRSPDTDSFDYDSPLAECSAGQFMYLDAEAATSPGQTFFYEVRAFYGGQLIANSSQSSAITSSVDSGSDAPFSFGGLGASFVVDDGVLLVWNSATGGDGSELYRVYRTDNGSAFDFSQPLAELSAGSILYLDTEPTLIPGQAFDYVVRAVFNGIEESNTTTLTAMVEPPVLPEMHFSGAGGVFYMAGQMTVIWNDAYGVDAADVSYRVYRAQATGAQDFSAPIASLAAGNTVFIDSDLPDTTGGVAYFYVVRAVHLGVEENNTREVSAQVLAEGTSAISCPADMVKVNNSFCVDIDEHAGLTQWRDDVLQCLAEGKHMCWLAEWYSACVTVGSQLTNMTNSYEWVQDSYSESSSLKVGYGSCDYISSHARDGGYAYRCCLR